MKDLETKIVFKNEIRKTSLYCKLCGKPLLFSYVGEDGESVDPIWEGENGVHKSCYNKYMAKKEKKREDDPEEKRLKEPISDEAMAKFIKKTEEEKRLEQPISDEEMMKYARKDKVE